MTRSFGKAVPMANRDWAQGCALGSFPVIGMRFRWVFNLYPKVLRVPLIASDQGQAAGCGMGAD